MGLNHPSEQATLNSEPILDDGAGKALLSYRVYAVSAQLHSNNLQVAIKKIPAGSLSHMDMTLKQGFFVFVLDLASLMLSSVSLF